MSKRELSTKNIWDMINDGATPKDLEDVIESGKTISDFFSEYIYNHPGLTAAEITRNANVSKSTANDIITGKKKGSRDKIFALCYGAHMSLKDVEHALAYSGNDELYPRRRRDTFIIYIFNNIENFPSIADVNIYLSDNGVEPLQTSKNDN